jgi:hypothetical protein
MPHACRSRSICSITTLFLESPFKTTFLRKKNNL